jgi:hypothetical protein
MDSVNNINVVGKVDGMYGKAGGYVLMEDLLWWTGMMDGYDLWVCMVNGYG